MDFSNEGSVYSSVRNNNNNNNNYSSSKLRKKKRFSDEQIRSLEVMFGSESKPDPGIKHQLAAELGLQPRQVAIWFQNRRARLKPKQIEREYDSLKASYDALACEFESLKKENLSLSAQLRTLMERVRMDRNGRMSEQTNATRLPEQGFLQQETKHDQQQCNGKEEQIVRVVEQPGGGGGVNINITPEMMYSSPFASSANSDYSCFLDQSSCGSSQWWEFW